MRGSMGSKNLSHHHYDSKRKRESKFKLKPLSRKKKKRKALSNAERTLCFIVIHKKSHLKNYHAHVLFTRTLVKNYNCKMLTSHYTHIKVAQGYSLIVGFLYE